MRPVIAYPGVAGSFSESAAQCAFPQGETRGYATFAQAAEAAQNGAADYALLPVENSFAGAVLPTYGLLEGLSLHIVGETLRRVRHQLVALPGATIEGLRTISSHPQAIAQCDAFLATVPWARLVPSANTAISAQEVAASGDLTPGGHRQHPGGGALRPDRIARRYPDQPDQHHPLPHPLPGGNAPGRPGQGHRGFPGQ